MHKVSFIIGFHTDRLDNLMQTLYFLGEREPVSNWELILVCQDQCSSISNSFGSTQQFNLNDSTYQRSRMINCGVKAATNPLIVLLDSDRILPEKYFEKICSNIASKQVFTTECLYRIKFPASNDQIKADKFECFGDFRSKTNELGRKNMFSGNTMMWREDYWDCGGMDESYVGYGFNDSDMTMTAIHKGLDLVYLDERELHLFHERDVRWNGLKSSDLKIMMAINGNRYCKKWNIYDEYIERLSVEVWDKLDECPAFSEKFLEECRVYKMLL